MIDQSVDILLVEDDQGDIDLMEEALKPNAGRINLQVVKDGVKALAYLRKEGIYQHARQPALILLDLNLPRKDGREVLSEIKKDERLKHIPVIVLTTSDAAIDIIKAYSLGANCYVTKPVGLNQFMEVMKRIQEFWLSTAELPNSRYP